MDAVLELFWRDDLQYVLGMVGAIGAVLYRARSVDRITLLHTLGLFLGALAGELAAAVIHVLGFMSASSVLRETFILAEGVAVIRLWGLLVFRIVLPPMRLAPAQIVEDMLMIAACVGFALVRLRYAGMDLSSIVTTSAVITAVVAFAMQDTLGNLLGGIALQLDRSVRTGDWIRIDDLVGRITAIRWRSTTIETRSWETVVVPNSVLMKGKFTVLGRRSGEPLQLRRTIGFNVDYGVSAWRVVEAVEQALRSAEIQGVARDPAPHCVLIDFQPSYARYAARYWLDDLLNDDQTDSVVRTHVLTALQRHGIRMAVPEYSVHSVNEDRVHEEAVAEREMQRRTAALRTAGLFAASDASELRAIASRLVHTPYARGAVVLRQGQVAHSMYVLARGRAEVAVEVDSRLDIRTHATPGRGTRRVIGVLTDGAIFGEMGLMTGKARAATVIAATELDCYRLDKNAFEDILQSRPRLAEEIVQIMLSRRDVLEAAQGEMDTVQAAQDVPEQQTLLLARIRRFFGLVGDDHDVALPARARR